MELVNVVVGKGLKKQLETIKNRNRNMGGHGRSEQRGETRTTTHSFLNDTGKHRVTELSEESGTGLHNTFIFDSASAKSLKCKH